MSGPALRRPAGRADVIAGLRRARSRRLVILIAGVLLLAAALVASVELGVHSMSLSNTLRALLAPVLPPRWTADIAPVQIAVLQNLRLPRTVMAIVAGAGLSMSGCALQGVTRNPLVSPYTLGISWAAAFGASVAILFGLNQVLGIGSYLTVACAFGFALICAALIFGFSALRGINAVILVLAGVGLNYLFNALAETVRFVATEQQLSAMIQWSFGSLNGKTWDEVALAGGVVAGMAPVFMIHAWALNAFAAGGDEAAAALGFAVGRTRTLVTVAAVMATAAIVSFTGVIAFVGLVGPHMARLLIGGDHRSLLPFSAIVGALLVVVADMIGRLAFAPVIIPVGIVVAYLGVPLFLHLLLSHRRELLS